MVLTASMIFTFDQNGALLMLLTYLQATDFFHKNMGGGASSLKNKP